MKTILSILLIFLSAGPAFCAPNFDPNNKAHFYDVSETQKYIQMLEDNYYKKYLVEISPTEAVINAPLNAWNKEVVIPSLKYIIEHPAKYVNN